MNKLASWSYNRVALNKAAGNFGLDGQQTSRDGPAERIDLAIVLRHQGRDLEFHSGILARVGQWK